MDTQRSIARRVPFALPHVRIQVEARPGKGNRSWTIFWNVTASDSLGLDLRQPRFKLKQALRNPQQYEGTPFKTAEIPVRPAAWPATPLAEFLAVLCNLGITRQWVLVIDDWSRDAKQRTAGPLVRWSQALVATGEGDVPLGALVPTVCCAAARSERSIPGLRPVVCLALLAPASNISDIQIRDACLPDQASSCGVLDPVHRKMLSGLDGQLFPSALIPDFVRFEVLRRLECVVCRNARATQKKLVASRYGALSLTGTLNSDDLELGTGLLLDRSVLRWVGVPETRFWLTMAIGAHSAQDATWSPQEREWLSWPYCKSDGPVAFISAVGGLSPGDGCFLIGVFLKLCWLGGYDLSTVAWHLWRLLRLHRIEGLAARLQLAACDPFEQMYTFSPGHPPTTWLRDLGSRLSSFVHDEETDRILRAAWEHAFPEREDAPEEINPEDWEEVFTSASFGQLYCFLKELDQGGFQAGELLDEFEELVWGVAGP